MRRIKHATVKRLALCKAGKNGLRTLFKSDGTAEWATLCKGDAEKGELLAVMYPKGMADEDGDFADTDEAIRSMTSSLIRNGGELDIEHDGKVLAPDAAYITEVFTIQPDDSRFEGWQDYQGNVVDVTGGSAVKIQIDDPALREAYRSGEWDGVSLFGPAAVEQVDLKAASKRVAARMGGVQEIEMNKEELQAALKAQSESLVELVKSTVAEAVAALKPAPKEEPKEAPKETKLEAPVFEGDPLDAEALAAYERSLRGFELRKAIASGEMTADKLAQLRKSLTEKMPSVSDLNEAGIEADEEDSAEVRKLQVQLFKARKGSNAPARVDTDETEELFKAQTEEGLKIAEIMNGMLGSAPSMSIVKG